MSLSNASILSGATMVAPTGGTALTFGSTGIENSKNVLYCNEDDNALDRRTIEVSVKRPKVSVSAPNGYTQQRTTFVVKSPLTLDNGNITVNTVRIEFSTDVETTDAEIDELRLLANQICSDADFVEAIRNRSLS